MDLAFIDVETTGLDPNVHEIVEVAAVRTDWRLRPFKLWSTKVRPSRIEDADPRALEINGYTAEGWTDAVELDEALRDLAMLVQNATLAGHNPEFDWGFLVRGFATTGLPVPQVDYHRVDTASLAWLTKGSEADSVSLDRTCERLGIEREGAHRALPDAIASLAVAQELRRLFSAELTLADVASALRVSEKTAYDMARQGQLPAFKVGRQWRMRRGDLDRWIDTQIAESA